MRGGAIVFLVLLLLLPASYSMSIKELISKYVFSASSDSIRLTDYSDFMIDRDNDGMNDTIVFELGTDSSPGNFTFSIALRDKNGIIANETKMQMNSGQNRLNITFASELISQSQFNYSIKIYGSDYSLKYRKDNIQANSYENYKKGFIIIGEQDYKSNKSIIVNITANSSEEGTYDSIIFLSYSGSAIFFRENKSLVIGTQDIIFIIDNETIKRTHYNGKFNLTSVKIGDRTLKSGFLTNSYNFMDFAASSYISGVSDEGVDTNNDGKYDALRLNLNINARAENDYWLTYSAYDLFGNILGTKNISYSLHEGNNRIALDIEGSRIFSKKMNGPFIVRYVQLFENGAITDQIKDYTTKNYNFNEFSSSNLPDLAMNISVSDGYHYGNSNVSVNITIKNSGSRPAFNVFFEIFDNRTFSKSNKSGMINAGSKIFYQLEITNLSSLEIAAIADPDDIIEESNESNNGQKIEIALNKKPVLEQVSNITINETGKIMLNLSASDENNDQLSYSVSLSKFSNISNIFEWQTSTTDSGNYTLFAAASDGFLNDSKIFRIEVTDVPEKDSDNDGINESVDSLLGNENSINTSTINITMSVDDSKNLSRVFNSTSEVRVMDGNSTIMEFNFDFYSNRLNLTNITINKQSSNSTGSVVVRGLKLPAGTTKTIYVERLNANISGICIKDEEISSISEISAGCDSANEHKVECDGTLQDGYTCAYNSTLGKYKVTGLTHSGIEQFDYTKPVQSPATSASSSAVSSSSGSGGGGGGIYCVPRWKCSDWSECIKGSQSRKCSDENNCRQAEKPEEKRKCEETKNKIQTGENTSTIVPISFGKSAGGGNSAKKDNSLLTGYVTAPLKKSYLGFSVIALIAVAFVILYFGVKKKIFAIIFK